MSTHYNQVMAKASFQVKGHPSFTIKEAMLNVSKSLPDDLRPDAFGQGKVINEFEAEMAEMLGKEAAVFFPSGTMAQQIAMRIYCDLKNKYAVGYHPLCHLEIHEKQGLRTLHRIKGVCIGNPNSLFTIDDLMVLEDVACVLFELPQREIGGQLPEWDELIEMIDYCKSKDIHVHLDGARLFEVLPYYNKSAQEVCQLFDSVYVSFYKGLGGITGAVLAGDFPFVSESILWKRRHGGDLYRLFPYTLTAKDALDTRKNRMASYRDHAKEYANLLSQINGIRIIPERPVCNMFHVYIDKEQEELETVLKDICDQHDIALLGNLKTTEDGMTISEIWIGDAYGSIDHARLINALSELSNHL